MLVWENPGRDRPTHLRSAETVPQRGRPVHSPGEPGQSPGPRREPASRKTGRAGGKMAESLVFVGIDVAKAELVIAVRPTGAQWTVPQTEAGWAGLVPQLVALAPTLVLLEATGGLELPVASTLAAAGLPVAVVNPRQVRDFAKATGSLAKTDAVDAGVLARFAEAVRPVPHPLPDAATRALEALVTRRRQLVELLTAEQNRLASAPPGAPAAPAGAYPVAPARTGRRDRGAPGRGPRPPRLARPGRPPAERTRRRPDLRGDLPGGAAGAWHAQPPRDRRPRRRRALESGQRDPAWAAALPGRTVLLAPMPNPSRGGAELVYALARSGEVVLELYGVDGRRVRKLASGREEAGVYRV